LPTVTVISVFTMILTASYLLWMLKRVFYGPFNTKWSWLPDTNRREAIPLYTLSALILFVGIYPVFLVHAITPSLTVSLNQLIQAIATVIH
jgi:NADH-quinone oxidoreductase subunit M